MLTTAVVKVRIGDDTLISAAEGNGPVNALDVALRKDLGKYQKYIDGLRLTDYRVQVNVGPLVCDSETNVVPAGRVSVSVTEAPASGRPSPRSTRPMTTRPVRWPSDPGATGAATAPSVAGIGAGAACSGF